MPWVPIQLTPGLNTELTPTANQAGYTATNLGRFKNGMFQKLGGWTKYYPNAIEGVPNAIHAHQDLAGRKHLSIGTSTDLLDITNGTLSDISPQTKTTNPVVNFSTTIGSNIVTIVDTAVSNITQYDTVFLNVPVTIGGLVLSGLYSVYTNISTTSYTIRAGANATASVSAPGGAIPNFTTTNGSAAVSVGLIGHGLSIGSDIIFPLSTTVGGVTISGRYLVQSIASADAFVITANVAASSGAGPTNMNGGNAGFQYQLALGPQVAGAAYGAGAYGAGAYGFGTAISGQTGTDVGSSNWSLDNWGELLIAAPDIGGIYYWGQANGYFNASNISTAPFYNTGIFISIAQQVIVSFGSTEDSSIGIYHDPMLVRWCDVGNFFDWTATVTNQAGKYRIPTGSRLVGGAATPHRNLIWSDLDLWSMDYIGSTLAFGFNKIGSNCGIISKHAHAQLSDVVYWMGNSGFFALSGNGVQALPCPVWDAVFQDLDATNISKCHACANTAFSEIWFFFPSASRASGKCDSYAKFNAAENTWDTGLLDRSAWIDQSVLGNPIATTSDSLVYLHETGVDADGSEMLSSFETGWFYVDGGREIVFVDRIYPDFRWGLFNGTQNSAVNITVKAVMYPGNTPDTYGPFTVTQADNFISQRLRARQIMLKVDISDIGSFARLGLVRVRWSPDGRQ